MSEEADASPKPVKTRVPAYQKDEWQDHADDLGMSLSEFVRTMVQAGRRGFDDVREETGSARRNPGGRALETRLQELLNGSVMRFDEIVAELSADLESELEDSLNDLKGRGVLEQGVRGEYTLLEGVSTDGE